MKKIHDVASSIPGFFLAHIVFILSLLACQNQMVDNDQDLPKVNIIAQADSTVSFRGISLTNDSVVWVSGSKSTIGRSTDWGKTWTFNRISEIDSLQFRDIHAFDAKTAIIISSGYPTRIYQTLDGGRSWLTVFASDDKRMFLDGMDFWPDGSGIAYGDPISLRWTILRTADFGCTWHLDTIHAPTAIDGEAGFAASGTGIICQGDSTVLFGSGGTASLIYHSFNRGRTWQYSQSGLVSGAPSQGVFSLAVNDVWSIAVGGDYAADTMTERTAAISIAHFNDWYSTSTLPYQSAVQIISDSVSLSVGTTGCYITMNQGNTWELFSAQSMHTLSINSGKNELFCAGGDGRIGKIIWK
jgi:photosystem II stability/assembly factor-like uncharacterized protein